MAGESYRDLLVWRKAIEVAKACYSATSGFPKTEMFGMVSQVRRAAASIAANIAEGQARSNPNEFGHFLRIARGSLAELETHLILCCEVELLQRDLLDDLLKKTEEVSRMLRGLQKSVAGEPK